MPEDPTNRPALLKALRSRGEAVCRDEAQRLARRAPTLTEAQQQVVGAALDGLVERLLLARTSQSEVHPRLIAELFCIPEQRDRGQ